MTARHPASGEHPAAGRPAAAIKGAAVREFLLWYERKNGEDSLAPLVADLPPELARLLDPRGRAGGILASSWYPCTLIHRMLDRICEGRTDEGRAMARDANAEVVPRMIRGVYGVLFRAIASPRLYAANIDRMWRRLHTTGKRTLVLRGGSEGLSVVEGWTGHHPTLCWVTIYTMVYLFHAMGYERVSVERLECVSHGAARCATLMRYA